MESIDLKKLSKETGQSELELAKAITMILAVKAEMYNIPQKVILSYKSPLRKSKERNES